MSTLCKSSVVSHPERGNGGKSSYRGNAGANFMRDVMLFGIENTKSTPQNFYFVDANEWLWSRGDERASAIEIYLHIKDYGKLDGGVKCA